MTALTEGLHAGSHIARLFDEQYNNDHGTVASGQDLVAGQLVRLSGGNLVAQDGSLFTDGSLQHACVGVMRQAVDATGGAVAGAVYLARGPAVVKLADLTFPTESTAGGEKAACIASLKTLGIIAR